MIFGANTGAEASLNRQALNQVAFLNSSQMRFAVAAAYNGSLPTGTVYNVSTRSVSTGNNSQNTSSVVDLSLVSSDPEQAATLVNVYARTYVSIRQAIEIDAEKLTITRAQLQALLGQIQDEIDDVSSDLTEIDAQIAAGADQTE